MPNSCHHQKCSGTSGVDEIVNTYSKYTYYHGTNKESAKNIYLNGMHVSLKKNGCNQLLKQSTGLNDAVSDQYNYVMGKVQAAYYAAMHGKAAQIVRMIVPSNLPLQKDPEGYGENEYRTKESLSSSLVWPLKRNQLNQDEIKKINNSLQINHKLCNHHFEKLIKKTKKTVYQEKGSDKKLIQGVTKSGSFIAQENARNETTKELLRKQGIDLSSLKEGDTFSVILD